MENKNVSRANTRIYKVLIRIMNKLLTIDIPGDWKISKIRKFLESNFYEQTKNSYISFIYSGKPVVTDDTIAQIVKVNYSQNKDKKDEELHQFIVIVKPKTENEIKQSIKQSMASNFDSNISREEIVIVIY